MVKRTFIMNESKSLTTKKINWVKSFFNELICYNSAKFCIIRTLTISSLYIVVSKVVLQSQQIRNKYEQQLQMRQSIKPVLYT